MEEKREKLMKYISRTSRLTELYRGRLLREDGIAGHQHVYILRVCQSPGISQEELARMIYINKSNVARQISSLEALGYIERRSDTDDKRIMRLYPTEKAVAVLPKIKKILDDWNRYLLEDFNSEEKDELFHLLSRVMEKAEKYVDEKIKEDEE